MGAHQVAVLNVGREPSFRELRHRLLIEAGYTVFSVETVAESEEALNNQPCDVLVVGAWVPKADRDQVVRMVKDRNQKATIVFYYDQNIEGTEQADAILNFRGDHADLVRTLQHLLSRTRGAAFKHLAGLSATCFPWVGYCF